MNFVDRVKNAVELVFGRKLFANAFESEMSAFKEKFGQNFEGYNDLIAKASYVMTNSNPYLDYPRPMLHKTVCIGGIAVSVDSKKNKLSEEWDAILNERSSTVLVSFGSMAKAVYMPDKYIIVLKTVASADSRLTAFMTHGGLGSTTELAHQGKPAVLVPLFGDQTRNAHMLAKHGGGIVLTKYDLENPKKIQESLLTIVNDGRYAENAKRLSEMLLNQPISAKQLLIRHSEYVAKFGRLSNLDPYGRQLTFVQYYLLDIAAVVACVFTIASYICLMLIRKCLMMSLKSKQD
ncbi:glycosyltransferase family 28 protein [Oesophagostomum dentatum]|uniref:glucuronosyltransferase n=1 Tax=Oesophagostomum dentatum TaxID=61180 RepID=A0A0B1TKY5_OESDE|nr:glycosyltransferase family 28 protein [Oesophagostomum dentatum]